MLGVSGKRIPAKVFAVLAGSARAIIFTGSPYKGQEPGAIQRELAALTAGIPTIVVADPKAALEMAHSIRQDDDVMGQPYLAGHLRRIGTPASAEALFKASELPVADFYKQLAWEVAQGHVKDNQTTLEPGHAAG